MYQALLAFGGGVLSNSLSPLGNPLSVAAAGVANIAMPNTPPSFAEILGSFNIGMLSENWFKHAAKIHGREFTNPEQALVYSRWNAEIGIATFVRPTDPLTLNDRTLSPYAYTPSIDESIAMYNRGLLNDTLFNNIMYRNTQGNEGLTQAWKQMRFEIPGPADLVRFAVRDCFSPEIVQQFEYAKETPNDIKPWMYKQGYGQDIGLAIPPNATDAAGNGIGGTATWFDLFWWSHWDLPSPTQGYEMLHRLYPTSEYGPSPYFNGRNGFTENDLSLLLKASDYPAYWRERLMSISYHNLNRSDVMPMYRDFLISKDVVYHALRADGYRHEEAEQLLALAEFQRAKSTGIDIRKRTKDWVCRAYKEGRITKEKAVEQLEAIGIPRAFIDGFLTICRLEMTEQINREVIAATKSAFIRGIYRERDVLESFNEVNIAQEVQDLYIRRWKVLKLVKYKTLSTRQNLKLFESSIITKDELWARLQNLGYENNAITLMTKQAEYKLGQMNLQRLQKQQIAEQKILKERLKAASAVQRQAIKTEKAKINNLKVFNDKRIHKIVKAATDKNIVDWAKGGLIELWEAIYRLYHKDFLVADAKRWIQTKFPDLSEEEISNAEKKAQKVYRSEPNPPLM